MRIAEWLVVLAALGVAACTATIPEGRYTCAASSDCPATWVCRGDHLCWRSATGSDLGADGPRGDAGDGGAPDMPLPDLGPLPCDATEVPVAAESLFVSARASDDVAAGTAGDPFKTIGGALAHADATHARIVIEEGMYPEAVVIPASAGASVRLSGGFNSVGATWTRDCASGFADRTHILSPSAIGIDASAIRGALVIESLTVETEATGASPADAAGESVYGVYGGAATLAVTIRSAVVRAHRAGDGGPPTPGGPAAPCSVATACSDGVGGADAPATAATPAGTFDTTGWRAGSGATGAPGNPGHDGTAPAAGTTMSCQIGLCAGVCPGSCLPPASSSVTGATGTCGCGGAPGAGGHGGGGGGASVGVLVSGFTSVVHLESASIYGGDGGDGSIGGGGGAGDGGGAGQPGASTSCGQGGCTSRGAPCHCEFTTTVDLRGPAGGHGGAGSMGASGGGGAGGDSRAVVLVGGATVDGVASSVLAAGTPGTGAGGASAGAAAPTWP